MLGKSLRCTQANISKLESGQIKPSLELATDIGKALSLNQAQTSELRELATNYLYDFDRWSFEETDQYYLYQNAIGSKERAASAIWGFNWNVIPGLLQTKEYIEEMHRPLDLDVKRLADVVSARLKRQLILEDNSKTFRFTLAEQCLYTLLTNSSAHVAQLKKLRAKLHRREGRISIRILPRDQRLSLIPNVNFTIFDFKSILVDEQYRTFLVWYEGQVEAYKALFSDLWEKALPGERALSIVETAIKHFDR